MEKFRYNKSVEFFKNKKYTSVFFYFRIFKSTGLQKTEEVGTV